MDYPKHVDPSMAGTRQGPSAEKQAHTRARDDPGEPCDRAHPSSQGTVGHLTRPVDMAGTADAGRATGEVQDTEGTPSDAASLLQRIAAELVRAHGLSLDLQAVFSRALGQVDAQPDLIRDAQDLDRLSQILENLARLLASMAAAHPEAPNPAQIERCLTLQDLQARLARPGGPPSSTFLGPSDAHASGEGGIIQAKTDPGHGGAPARGDISWL